VPETLIRSLLVSVYVTISLLGLSAIGLFISTLTMCPVGAMAATIVLSVVSQVLDSIPQLGWLHPWLFTHYWLGVGDLLRQPISWDSFGSNSVLQAAYIVLFGALAYGRFSTKDVLPRSPVDGDQRSIARQARGEELAAFCSSPTGCGHCPSPCRPRRAPSRESRTLRRGLTSST